jgi:hypothetical protein
MLPSGYVELYSMIHEHVYVFSLTSYITKYKVRRSIVSSATRPEFGSQLGYDWLILTVLYYGDFELFGAIFFKEKFIRLCSVFCSWYSRIINKHRELCLLMAYELTSYLWWNRMCMWLVENVKIRLRTRVPSGFINKPWLVYFLEDFRSFLLLPTPLPTNTGTYQHLTHLKVKQPVYWPVQALRLPEEWDFKISRQSVREGCKVVSPTHWPLLRSREHSWHSFLLEAKSNPGP